MPYTVEISDESYQTLVALATRRGQQSADLLEQWLREVRAQTAVSAVPAETTGYDRAVDPLASFLGAFEATAPDVVRTHDAALGEG